MNIPEIKHVCHLTYFICALLVSLSLDHPHTSDSWPLSEPLLLTNKISKPIIFVLIHERHVHCPPCCHIPRSLHSRKKLDKAAHFSGTVLGKAEYKDVCTVL